MARRRLARLRRGRTACCAIAGLVALVAVHGSALAACDGDAASNACSPGTGSSAANCTAEWVLTPQPASNAKGLPGARLVCSEGDPACDVDDEVNVCSF